MVQVTNVTAERDYVVVEFLTNGITISTRVYGHAELTPQQIVERGYAEVRPHIDIECYRQGIKPDHALPKVEDELLGIRLLGIEHINFSEGQKPIEKRFRCAGDTRYGKVIDLTEIATFTPANPVILEPCESGERVQLVEHGGFRDERSYSVTYTSYAEANARAVQDELDRIAAEKEEADRIANTLPPMEAVLDDLISTLVEKGVL